MFGFLRNSPSPASSSTIRRALIQHGLPPGVSDTGLQVVTRKGDYAGRPVRFFSAFDTQQAASRGLATPTFNDLDTHPDLVVGSGHVDHDGAVWVTRGPDLADAPTPARALADRAGHADDAHLVFWDAEGSRTSALHLSEAALAWSNARSK